MEVSSVLELCSTEVEYFDFLVPNRKLETTGIFRKSTCQSSLIHELNRGFMQSRTKADNKTDLVHLYLFSASTITLLHCTRIKLFLNVRITHAFHPVNKVLIKQDTSAALYISVHSLQMQYPPFYTGEREDHKRSPSSGSFDRSEPFLLQRGH